MKITWRATAILIVFMLGLPGAAVSAELNPLRPPDLSSPRATLQGFIEHLDEAYRRSNALMREYATSNRLYLSADEREQIAGSRSIALKAVQALDTSEISPVLRQIVSAERAIQLKEILDRIELPPFDAIPDRAAMVSSGLKRWRIPNTEIDLVLIEKGPKTGDYLVSAATVQQLPEFYERVKDLPYKPGPAKEISDVYRTLSGNHTITIYEIISNSPIGLERIVPTRWMMKLPGWTKARIIGVAVWQWLGFIFGDVLCALFVFAAYRLARRLAKRRGDKQGPGWHSLLTPLAIIIVALFVIPVLSIIFRISGSVRVVVAFAQTAAVFLSAAWVSLVGAGVLGETIAASERLTRRSLDSQLIRLVTRFIGIVIAVALLMEAADELGFPAYSVLAGLGVGGLAIALAARDSLANFLGSVLIMFEKPFRVGHRIKVGGSDGVVEEVGFRSTRIRTLENSLVSIPNSVVVNATVENMALRVMFRQRFFVQVTYDTPAEKLEALSLGIRQILAEHPSVRQDNFHVRFNELGDSSLNILVLFHLNVANSAVEMREREVILYRIMALAQELGVEFAFPTRTLRVAGFPAPPGSRPVGADVFGTDVFGAALADAGPLKPAANDALLREPQPEKSG